MYGFLLLVLVVVGVELARQNQDHKRKMLDDHKRKMEELTDAQQQKLAEEARLREKEIEESRQRQAEYERKMRDHERQMQELKDAHQNNLRKQKLENLEAQYDTACKEWDGFTQKINEVAEEEGWLSPKVAQMREERAKVSNKLDELLRSLTEARFS